MNKITIEDIGSKFGVTGNTIKNWIKNNPELKGSLAYKTHKKFAEQDFEVVKQFILAKYRLI